MQMDMFTQNLKTNLNLKTNNKMKTQKTQLEFQQDIINFLGINIVNCGNCGVVVLHEIEMDEIICPTCGFTSEPCHFPDLNN